MKVWKFEKKIICEKETVAKEIGCGNFEQNWQRIRTKKQDIFEQIFLRKWAWVVLKAKNSMFLDGWVDVKAVLRIASSNQKLL